MATAAPIKVDPNRCSAVVCDIPGPMTMSAVTGTFTEATSPKCSARATTAQRMIVMVIAINPKSKMETAKSAVPAPIAVPTICPNPSRIDLWSEIRMLSVETIAATTPPPSTKRSPKNQATPPESPATRIWRTQSLRSAKSFTARFNIKKRVYALRLV